MARTRLDRDGAVAVISLARPERRNALDQDMLRELAERVDEACDDDDAAVILLRADGRIFSVGGDVGMFAEAGERAHDLLLELGDHVVPAARRMHETPKITIAAVQGAVAGGAIGFMASCDLVLAADGTTFCMGYAALGTSPDAGASWFVTRDIGYRRALELYLTNERLDAERALAMGLVNRVVAPDELDAQARELAQRIAAGPRAAMEQGKRLFRQSATTPLADHLRDEIEAFARNTRSPDFAEGIAAFHARRAPQFTR